MPQNPRSPQSRFTHTPDIARPPLPIWQPLESERIRWEGQVQIVGQGADLPALLVITGKRLALIANNEIALEFPLGWMRPEPRIVAENGIRLFISPNGDTQVAQPMLIRAKSGRTAAMEIAAVLTGRTFASRAADSPMHIPVWKQQVGASASVALPTLADQPAPMVSTPKPAWPPAESGGVEKSTNRPETPANAATPIARPIPNWVGSADRFLGTATNGTKQTVATPPVAQSASADPNRTRARYLWAVNLALFAVLVAGFAYVAIDRGYGAQDIQALVPNKVATYLGIDTTPRHQEIALAPDQASDIDSAQEIAKGGDNQLLPVKNTNPVPTSEPQPTSIANEPLGTRAIGGPGATVPVTAGALGTPAAADQTPVSTEAIATEEPSPVDPTIDPTVGSTPEELETPEPIVAPTQSVTVQQAASVAPDTVPDQQFQAGGIRYTIDAVASGAQITDLPEINNIGQTWVVATITGANTSNSNQPFDMSQFTLWADGQAILLDTGTAWVNSLLGNDPAYGNTDTATWAPGEQHQFTLTFLAPANVSNLVLQADDQMIDLNPAITNSVGLRETTHDKAPVKAMTGTVVDVVDGQTIVVEVDGELVTVRYVGIDAPTGDACYANEATLINASLVEGKTVTLERQSVDVNARGVWVRDVWVTDNDGQQVLVSQALVSQGAATSKVSEPNSRYAGWLLSTEQSAQDSGVGLWSACGSN